MEIEELKKLLGGAPMPEVCALHSDCWVLIQCTMEELADELGNDVVLVGPPDRERFVSDISERLADWLMELMDDSPLRDDWIYREECTLKTTDAESFAAKIADGIGEARQMLCAPFELEQRHISILFEFEWGTGNE